MCKGFWRKIVNIFLGSAQGTFPSPAEKLEKYLLKTDQSKQAIPPTLYYKQINTEKTIIDGYPCYFLTSKGGVQENKVIFYLHGGGFIYEMHPMHQ